MSKAQVIVLSVVQQGLSKAEAARRFKVSWRWVHTLVRRYEADGLAGLEPRSRRPRRSPQQIGDQVRQAILDTRDDLTAQGWDAGPVTIAARLRSAGLRAPATSTINLILHAAGLVT